MLEIGKEISNVEQGISKEEGFSIEAFCSRLELQLSFLLHNSLFDIRYSNHLIHTISTSFDSLGSLCVLRAVVSPLTAKRLQKSRSDS
jgi:hypothetical protein